MVSRGPGELVSPQALWSASGAIISLSRVAGWGLGTAHIRQPASLSFLHRDTWTDICQTIRLCTRPAVMPLLNPIENWWAEIAVAECRCGFLQ